MKWINTLTGFILLLSTMRYVSLVALTFLAFAFESAATPVLTLDKDLNNSSLSERSMNDMQDGIVPFQKRVLITTPSPITFSSIGRKSRMNKVVKSSSLSTTTNTNTNTIRTNGIGSGVVTRNQNLAVGNLRGQPITTNRRITRTQNSSTSSTTTTRKASSSSAATTTTTTRNGGSPLQSITTVNTPINIGINTQVL